MQIFHVCQIDFVLSFAGLSLGETNHTAPRVGYICSKGTGRNPKRRNSKRRSWQGPRQIITKNCSRYPYLWVWPTICCSVPFFFTCHFVIFHISHPAFRCLLKVSEVPEEVSWVKVKEAMGESIRQLVIIFKYRHTPHHSNNFHYPKY